HAPPAAIGERRWRLQIGGRRPAARDEGPREGLAIGDVVGEAGCDLGCSALIEHLEEPVGNVLRQRGIERGVCADPDVPDRADGEGDAPLRQRADDLALRPCVYAELVDTAGWKSC